MYLLPLLITGLSAAAINAWENRAALQDPDLTPKVWGMNAQTWGMGLGAAAALLGGPFLAPIGVGTFFGSAASWDTTAKVQEGLEPIVARLMAQQTAPQGALPGPGAQPGAQPGGYALPGWLEQLVTPAP